MITHQGKEILMRYAASEPLSFQKFSRGVIARTSQFHKISRMILFVAIREKR